ncbi:MAG: hypothetical protein J3Q66DRAFT_386564 [Benniella sp.]|nr:MAG: hypothetical protein J3Q66DRAFT_386564 [Benniella sp.]
MIQTLSMDSAYLMTIVFVVATPERRARQKVESQPPGLDQLDPESSVGSAAECRHTKVTAVTVPTAKVAGLRIEPVPDGRSPISNDRPPLLSSRPISLDSGPLLPVSCESMPLNSNETTPLNQQAELRRRLPLECIVKIIRLITEEYDTDTMFRLLCVDKLTCATTLPFLYEDCFNINMHTYRPRSKKTASITMSQLIRTLLWQIRPQDQVPGLLQVAYLWHDQIIDLRRSPRLTLDWGPILAHIANSWQAQGELRKTIGQPTPVSEYGGLIRKIVLDQDLAHVFDFQRNPHVIEYAVTHQLYKKYRADGTISGTNNDIMHSVFLDALGMDVRRLLTWTLCQARPEHVEELSIPSTDIERYVNRVNQFKSLSKIIFTLGKIVRLEDSLTTAGQKEGDWIQHESERHRLFRAMVHLVKRHTFIHVNVLRQVVLPDPYHIPGTPRYPVENIRLEIDCLLLPASHIQTINSHEWHELVARLTDINLGYVESIKLAHLRETIHAEKTLAVMSSQPPFLPRCRSLKHLEIETLGPDMFHWAVLEKRQQHQQESMTGSYGLVPLRSVEIIHRTPMQPVQELDDMAFAFSDSLEELIVREKSDAGVLVSTDLGTTPRVLHGEAWTLPRLRILDFQVLYSQLYFDMDALQRFCVLETLCLADRITTYSPRDRRSWPSINLPHLKNLTLIGSPALSFNLDSLRHSPSLNHLHLRMPDLNNRYYIPPPEDLECEEEGPQGSLEAAVRKRIQLAWDWDFLKLHELDLKAEFAFKFDFQWLQYLPNLRSLSLNTSSTAGKLHTRCITLEDLSKASQQEHQDDEQNTSRLYFVSPELQQIVLHGHWNICAEVLKILCLVVAPNLHKIHLGAGCVGHSLGEWVTLSRKMDRVEQLCSDRQFPDDEIQELGIVPSTDSQKMTDKRVVELTLSGAKFLDILDL